MGKQTGSHWYQQRELLRFPLSVWGTDVSIFCLSIVLLTEPPQVPYWKLCCCSGRINDFHGQ